MKLMKLQYFKIFICKERLFCTEKFHSNKIIIYKKDENINIDFYRKN